MKKIVFYVIILGIVLLTLISCMAVNVPVLSRVRGSGKVITEKRQVSGFTRLSVSSVGRMELSQGEAESLTIEAEDNIMALITSEVRNGTLYIEFNTAGATNINPTVEIKYTLSMPDIEGLEVSGAADIYADAVSSRELEIESSGAGTIRIRSLQADRLDIEISGAGNIELDDGIVPVQVVDLSGAGSYDSSDVESREIRIAISGAGKASVWVKEKLEADISGTGILEYYGAPELASDISGTGKIRGLGEK